VISGRSQSFAGMASDISGPAGNEDLFLVGVPFIKIFFDVSRRLTQMSADEQSVKQ